ncbi:MAG: hypothetical protein D6826_06845 [Alphaproteobacteria bacterium]|nr:MAG: hypothetical protein D6826_06845 [Alphaproteobacteria bacterium]
MITFGICLIYYGIALFLYQANGWLTAGRWTPFPVLRAWEAFFGIPHIAPGPFQPLALWFLNWPLSLALLFGGVVVLGLVFACQRLREVRRRRARRRWIEEQCTAMGYRPWAVPALLREIDREMIAEAQARKERGL